MSAAGAASSSGSADVPRSTFLAVTITLTCVAALFVFTRVFTSWQRKAKKHVEHIDDYVTILALLVIAATIVGYNQLILVMTDPTTSIKSLMSLSHGLTWLGSIMMWGCKVPVLLLYVVLFGIKTWVKVTAYGIMIVTGTIFLIMSSFITARCNGNMDDIATFLPRCTDATTRTGFTLGMVSVLTDAAIFVLPLPVIWRLHLPVHKRFGVAMVFITGLAAIAASAISTHYKYNAMRFSSTTGTNAMICTVVECTVALMVACVPAIYGLWSNSVVNSGIYSRMSSALSQLFVSRSSRSSRSGASDHSVKSKEPRSSDGSMKLSFITHGPIDSTMPSKDSLSSQV